MNKMRPSAPKKSWKTVQKQSKLKKRTKFAALILLILLSTLFFKSLVGFVEVLNQPFSADKSFSQKNYSWDGQANINLVVKGQGVEILSFNPALKSITLVKIPNISLIDLPFDLGQWQAGSIYDLGQTLSPPQGRQLLKLAMGNLMGIPLDGFIWVEGDSQQMLTTLKQNPLMFIKILPTLQTDLSLPELWSLQFGLYQVRFDKVSRFDLIELNLGQKSTLPDGSAVFIPDPIKIDSQIPSFKETNLLKEGYSVAIFNGTKIVGLAQRAARMINNMGGVVIISTNTTAEVSKSFVDISEENKELGLDKSQSFLRYQQIFGSNGKIEVSEVTASRAQINIILGQDFADRF